MPVWLIKVSWPIRPNCCFSACCSLVLRSPCSHRMEVWDCCQCNSYITISKFPPSTANCRALKGEQQIVEMQSPQKTSTWFYNNPPETLARLLVNLSKIWTQNISDKVFQKSKIISLVSWALHCSGLGFLGWFRAIISTLSWKKCIITIQASLSHCF